MQQYQGYAKPVQWRLIVIVNVNDIDLARCCNAAHIMCKRVCYIR